MSGSTRREALKLFASTALGLSVRSAVTGLPLSFLLTGNAFAATPPRVTILGCSGAGESVNCNGPGSFAPGAEAWFSHAGPEIDYEAGDQVVDGTLLVPGDLEIPVDSTLGAQPVRMAKAWATLPADLRAHLVWFNYRSLAGIHPQFPTVLRAHGALRGALGRGSEELPAAIAQDTAAAQGAVTHIPMVLGGSGFSSNGAPVASYSPTKLKALVDSMGRSVGGLDNFGALHDYFIDETYHRVRTEGTVQQRAFLDQHAMSRTDAAQFGQGLGDLLADIHTDSIQDQLYAAIAIAKLRLAPVVVTQYAFSGDNHSDNGLVEETEDTFRMLSALDAFWRRAKSMGVLDDIVYATADVFGRDTRATPGRGRGHHGALVSGLILGNHLRGGVVGGHQLAENHQVLATGIHTTTGGSDAPDVAADDTLALYYKSVMRAAGVPQGQRDVRFPDSKEVTSFV